MSKKKWLPIILLLMVAVNWIIFQFSPNALKNMHLVVTMSSNKADEYQFFYADDGNFNLDQVSNVKYETIGKQANLSFDLGTSGHQTYRMDFGSQEADITIYGLKFVCGDSELELPFSVLEQSINRVNIQSISEKGSEVLLKVEAGDPRCQLQMGGIDREYINNFIQESSAGKTLLFRILVCIALDILLIGIWAVGRHVKTLTLELLQNRRLVLKLSYNDFKTKYVGSYLGIVWAFIQPIITVLVYWFVFAVGFRSTSAGNVPFVLYLVSGLVPWFFFSDALSGGTNALIEYQYLVKKIVFKISMLPVVKLISALFVHVFFIFVAIVIGMLYGYMPGLHTIQIIYYMLCNFVFSLALVYITCAIVVFFRDTTQIINIVLQVGIWMTPIMWNLDAIPKNLHFIFKLIPMYYLVDGYRDAIVYGGWIWDKFYETILFWFITAALFGIGTLVFKRLKVHFADVL